MKRIYNYILLAALTFMAIGCVEESLKPDMPSSGCENDVKFGLSLEDPKTRTIYGAEANNAFPVYWSEGDKVLVASPQCAVNSAEYAVTPISGQSYAEALNKTGAAGVQWGSKDASFYSVYPSTNASWTSLTESNVTAKLNIASEQEANLTLDNGVYGAADMSNVIMYAEKLNVTNGSVVQLNYKPYSTVLEIDLGIAQNKDDQGNSKGYGTVKIESITLTAPTGTNITGDFTLTFNGSTPTIAPAGNNGDAITMQFVAQPMLSETNQTLKAKIALIPLSGITSLKDWTISVTVYEGTDTVSKTYTKTLDVTSALTAGQIHKIKLPRFYSTTKWEPDLDQWITQLYDYKNIYLTELSVPGAWYAGAPADDGYQATADIATLWNAGVRGFAVECRTCSEYSNWSYVPSSVIVSGTGESPFYVGDAYIAKSTVVYIRDVISDIATAVAATVTTDENGVKNAEYAVLVLSYADGGDSGHRDEDHAFFINGIKTEIAESGTTNIVYSSEITPNTTIADVIGKLIIMVNVDYELTKGDYNGSMNALLTYVPHVDHLEQHLAENETTVDYSKIRFSPMYWQTWVDDYKVTPLTTPSATDNLYLCFASANRTQLNTGTNTTIPTYAERQEALRSMIVQSRQISSAENSAHNVLFFFNAGGTQATSQTSTSPSTSAFAAEMNPWLLEVIKLKANGGTDTSGYYSGTVGTRVEADPSSLGLVFFNQCTSTSYNGPEIINEIIMMNDKFKLLRATDTDNPDEGGEEGDEV